MASGVTNYQVPQAYTPAYNPMWFVASSTNTAQPNFKYTVKVTDVITSEVLTFQEPGEPNLSLIFNANAAARQFIKNYIPINSYGWKVCTDAVRQIKVNIGETYDVAGTPTYTAGTDKFFYIWNSIRDLLQFQSYAYTAFVYDAGTVGTITPRTVWLTDSLPEYTYEGRSNLFYALTSQVGDLATIRINTYDINGGAIGTSYIANPQVGSGTYTNKYLCIDLGHKGLSNIAGGLVTGTFPILTSSVAYYEVFDVSVLNNGFFPAATQTFIKRYTVAYSPRYEVITLHCLFRNGHYRTVHCPLAVERTTTTTKSEYKKLPYEQLSALADITYKYEAAVEQVLSVSIQDKLKVNTNWLTESESALYKQVVTSSSILMDLGTGQGYASVKCIDGSYAVKKHTNDKLFQVSFNLQYTHDNQSQHA